MDTCMRSYICYTLRYFADNYSHFCFSFEPYYSEMGGSEVHYEVRIPSIVLSAEINYRGGKQYA